MYNYNFILIPNIFTGVTSIILGYIYIIYSLKIYMCIFWHTSIYEHKTAEEIFNFPFIKPDAVGISGSGVEFERRV